MTKKFRALTGMQPVRSGALRVIAAILLFSALAPIVLGQSQILAVTEPNIVWVLQFGSSGADGVADVTVDQAGNIYVVGSTDGVLPGQNSSGDYDAFVWKFDSGGNTVWIRQFGSSGYDRATSVAVDEAGFVYVVGWTNRTLPGQTSSGSSDAFIRVYHSDGKEVWTHQFGSSGPSPYPNADEATGIAVDRAGNAYVVGNITIWWGGPGRWYEVFVRAFDKAGRDLWTRQFTTFELCSAFAVAAQPGGVYIAGNTGAFFPGYPYQGNDSYARKYDSDGNEVWTRQFGTVGNEWTNSIALDDKGNAYISGDTLGVFENESSYGSGDAYVYKLDKLGEAVWIRQFGTTKYDSPFGIAVDWQGSAYVVGWTGGTLPDETSSGEVDAFIRKYDSNGNKVWTHQFGTSGVDAAFAAAIDNAGSAYVAGTVSGALPGYAFLGGVSDAFLIKIAGP